MSLKLLVECLRFKNYSLHLQPQNGSGFGLVMADEILAWESISSLQSMYFFSSGCGAVG